MKSQLSTRIWCRSSWRAGSMKHFWYRCIYGQTVLCQFLNSWYTMTLRRKHSQTMSSIATIHWRLIPPFFLSSDLNGCIISTWKCGQKWFVTRCWMSATLAMLLWSAHLKRVPFTGESCEKLKNTAISDMLSKQQFQCVEDVSVTHQFVEILWTHLKGLRLLPSLWSWGFQFKQDLA